MLNHVIRLSVFFIFAILISGCSAKIGKISDYSAIELEECDFMPNEAQLKSAKTKVVVFEFKDNGIETAANANLNRSVIGEIESQVHNNAIELVDRSAAENLKQEIMVAEAEGTGGYEGPPVADFAISGSIDNAGFTSRFSEAYTTVDKKGRKYYHPAKFTYTAEVSGKIKIYEIPSLKVAKTIAFKDNAQLSEETRSSQVAKTRNDELVRKAAADGIHGARIELKNFFAKKGYIFEKRAKEDTSIFKVSIGADDGLKSGDSCQIYTIKKAVNPITKEETAEEHLLGEGEVSEKIGPNYAWLLVKEGDLQQDPRLGDFVKVKYEKGIMDALNSTGSLLNALAK